MATDSETFGDDYSTFQPDGTIDVDLTFPPITGPQCIAEAVARRWVTQRGSAFWDKSLGLDIRRLVNADYDRRTLELYKIALAGEALKVEGVKSASVTITPTAGEGLEIRGDLVLDSGAKFSLMFPIADAANATRLFVQETA